MQIMNTCQPGIVRQRITDIMIMECHVKITESLIQELPLFYTTLVPLFFGKEINDT
jgi:hypothetical protein